MTDRLLDFYLSQECICIDFQKGIRQLFPFQGSDEASEVYKGLEVPRRLAQLLLKPSTTGHVSFRCS